MDKEINLLDNKYKVVYNFGKDFKIDTYRYGEKCQNLVGNNVVLGLILKIEELQDRLGGIM